MSILLLALAISTVSMVMAGTVVTINADKVMVLDGRKIFPITMSPGPPTNGKTPLGDDALEDLGDAGTLMFRMSQTTDWNASVIADQQAALDWAAAHGMYCLVNLRELSAFASGDIATETELRSVVNQFKNHSALGVWKNKDEAWWSAISGGTDPQVMLANLTRGYNVIHQEDTSH